MSSQALQWQLSQFLDGVEEAREYANIQISGLSQTDQDMTRGDLFLALAGRHTHGLQFAEKATEVGVAAVAWEPSTHLQIPECPKNIPCIRIDGLAARAGQLAARFYHYPSSHLNVMAVTGTDGKSSVSLLLAQALNKLCQRCGVIGTLGSGMPGNLRATRFTTPPPALLQKELYRLRADDECAHVAIEASSHALDQGRFAEVKVNTAILTNITRDHLDYHPDREHYIAAKSRLFFASEASNCVLNLDDETGRVWAAELKDKTRVLTYSSKSESSPVNDHFYARSIKANADGLKFELRKGDCSYNVSMSLYGAFNVQNSLAVTAALYAQGFSSNEIAVVLGELSSVPGRMQVIKQAGFPVIAIDYAHTPAALEAALAAMREHFSGKLYCVFGCGGNRDRGKRSVMGEVALRLADQVILTSDNPRNEDPRAILKDIAGEHAQQFILEEDRLSAIEIALQKAHSDDAILIAGKGHEQIQELAGQAIQFSDYDQVKQLLQRGVMHG